MLNFRGVITPKKRPRGKTKAPICVIHIWEAENTCELKIQGFWRLVAFLLLGGVAWWFLLLSTYFVSICESLPFDSFFLDAGSITTPRRKTAEVLCPYIFWVQDAIMESEGLKQGIPYPKECTACNHSGGDCLMGWEEHSNLQFLFGSFVRLGWYETSGGVEEGWLFIWV